ncbi:hypothetical protein ACE411_08255 [Alteromonas macleodii]
MPQYQRREVQDWPTYSSSKSKAGSPQWRFVANSRLMFKLTTPGVVIFGYSEQAASLVTVHQGPIDS